MAKRRQAVKPKADPRTYAGWLYKFNTASGLMRKMEPDKWWRRVRGLDFESMCPEHLRHIAWVMERGDG